LRHSRTRDAAAIHHHYDVSNTFYEWVLGPSMTYTCACYPRPDATLVEAQENKYRLVFEKLRLKPGDRLLDVGCGWGGMVRYAARHGVKAVGVTMSDHGVEVASSDRHTVKPWFAGRIDYSPPVHDLTAQGFPLLGGRVDLIDGRKVAVLVYRHNQHRIALILWPASGGDTTPSVDQRDGFALADWRRGGFAMRAVADLSPAEMKSFAAAVDQAVAADR